MSVVPRRRRYNHRGFRLKSPSSGFSSYLLNGRFHSGVSLIIATVIFLAIRDYETAAKHSENDRQIKEGLDRAQRLLKQSKKRDYYKILGVKR